MTYNGWTNYETWLTNIHFDNWEFSEYVEQIADTEPEDEGDVRNWLEDYIRESVRDLTFEQVDTWNNPWISDLVMAAFSEIDFRDLAEHYSEEVWEQVRNYLGQEEAEQKKQDYQAIIDEGSY